MLTESELNQVKGLLHYLNAMSGEIKADDIKMIDSNGEEAAVLGYDVDADEFVLKSVNP